MTKIYFVRHCNSLTNIKKVLAGWFDTDISETGEKQLEYLSERFRDIKLDKVYASPLKRAHKTGLAVNKYPNAPFELCENFKEIYIGEFEGESADKMSDEQYGHWTGDITKFRSQKGETAVEAFERFKKGFINAVEENEGKTIAIASHGAVLRLFTCFMKGLDLSAYRSVEGMSNTAVTIVEYSKETGFNIILENNVSHLPEELITFGWKAALKNK